MTWHGRGNREGLGSKYFEVVPRVGDYFAEDDAEGVGQAYRVLRVILATGAEDEHGGCAGDLWVKHVGTSLDLECENVEPLDEQ
jgi:thioredoxin reductase